MDPSKPQPIRGRARGRASRPTPPAEGQQVGDVGAAGPATTTPVVESALELIPVQFSAALPETVERSPAYEHMFASSGNGNGDGNGNGSGNGTGGSGNGSGNGSNHEGDGNGHGQRGRSSSGERSPRGTARGSPRGSGGRSPPAGAENAMPDYVVSRPTADFQKSGTTGKIVPVIANYYQFRKHAEFQMTLYAVKVEPEVDENWIPKKLIRSKAPVIGSYILSGRQLFTTRPLKEEVLSFHASLEDAPDTLYRVELEFKRSVGESEGVVLQFYNIIAREMQELLDYKMLGRHYFDPDQAVSFANWKLELWPGFSNSIRQQEKALMLNVDSCWKVLQTDNILSKITAIRRDNPSRFEAACNEEIVGMMVITKYNKKAYKVNRMDFTTTPTHTFETKRGPTTYMDYYSNRYGISIRNTNQVMLVSEPKLRDIRRGQTNDIYLVPELCYPCGLNDSLRSNFRLMKDIATCLHMDPTERVNTMQAFIKRVEQNEQIQTMLKSWGVKVSSQPVDVTARLLPPQEVLCGGNQTMLPDDKADWTNGLRSRKMFTSSQLNTWAMVVTSRDAQGVGNLIATMQRVAGPLGYRIENPAATIIVADTRSTSYVKGIDDAIVKCNGRVNFIFVVLANNNADTYAAVKKRCSIDKGIPSQCFLSKNLTNKGLMSICTKMVIQMNAKQGGEPWLVRVPSKTMMVLGYDVHHAGPKGGMSIGAMTATVTSSLGSFFSTVSKLPSREEVATTVASMFDKCLNAYFEKNGKLPDRIMMYRDGVGEGQLHDTYTQELQGFKDRIKVKYTEKKEAMPKLSYIVVNKRISTRFFEKVGQNKSNPKPGLVVDDVVTRPERYDFFLISQTARQGCVGPTYYNVLSDESGLTADRLQLFTYKLCHLYYNWTGCVAVPGPCQNAHKLAFLVGTSLKRPAHKNLEYLLHFL